MDPLFLTSLNWVTLSHAVTVLFFVFLVIFLLILNYKKVVRILRVIFDKEDKTDKTEPTTKPQQTALCPKCPIAGMDVIADKVKSETTIRQFVRASVVPTIFINFDHEIQAINPLFEDLTGYKFEEIVGLDLSVIVPERYSHMHAHFVKEYIEGIDKDYNIRIVNKTRPIEIKTKDGSVIKATLKVNLIQNGVSGFLGFLQKIDQ